MKQFKRFCAAALLTLALSIAAFAGDIQGPPVANPGAPTDIQPPLVTIPVAGEIGAPGVTATTDILEFTVEFCLQFLSIF